MSSLVAQLAQGASLNSSLLVDRSRRKPSESYLFTGRDADLHDLESIHALGSNGLLQLASVDPEIGAFEAALFSDASKETDRTLLPLQAIQDLDRNIASFLARLGPYLMEAPTGKVLEWLVRRFRINEFNVESLLSLFLPYHESPHFAKMVTILHLKPNTMWDFLIPFQKAAQSVPRIALVKEMLKNTEVTRFITNLLPSALKAGSSHRTLLAFNAATLHDYLAHKKDLDDGTVAHILPALLEPLHKRSDAPKDAVLGSYILLAALSHKCQFSADALKTIVSAMINSAKRVSAKQFINAVVSVVEAQDELQELPKKHITTLLRISNLNQELKVAVGWIGIEKLLNPLLGSLTQSLEDGYPHSPDGPPTTLAVKPDGEVVVARRLLQHVHQRYPAILHVDNVSTTDEDLKGSLEQLVLSLFMNQSYSEDTNKDHADMVIAATSADAKVRLIATGRLVGTLRDKTLSSTEEESVRSALIARTQDTMPMSLSPGNIAWSWSGDLIEKSVPKTGPGSYELLSGCAEIWIASKADSIEKMATFQYENGDANGRLITSSRQTISLTMWTTLVTKSFAIPDGHVRLLACIIARALLRRLTGSHQVNTALKIVQALDLDQLAESEDSAGNHIDDAKLGRTVAAKPNSKNTLYWAQVSIMTIAAEVPPPEGVVVNWLSQRSEPDISDDRDFRYVSLMRTIYRTATSSSVAIMMNTFSVLFATIQDDALAFFVGIWLTSVDHAQEKLALGHCVALLKAFKASETPVDFQTVLPSLLVALQSSELKHREYALLCLALMAEGTQRKYERVYAFDAIYGSSAAQLLYLSQDDLTKYLTALVAHREHFIHDPGYVVVFHQDYLSASKTDKRKVADHKHNVMCYLASHINAAPSRVQFQLLKTVGNVVDEGKAASLKSSVTTMLSMSTTALQELYGQGFDEYVCLLASIFNVNVVNDLNNDTDGLWTTYCNLLTHLFKSSPPFRQEHINQQLEQGLFMPLLLERQLDLCTSLLGLSTQDQDVHLTVTKLLTNILREPTLVVELLKALQPDPVDAPPASKRLRMTSETSEDTLPQLTVLAEVLAAATLPGSLDIIIALVQTLNNVIQSSTTSDFVDVAFIEQSLMTAVANVADKVTEVPNLSPGAIRLEVVVDLIRTADNPQTFQQALLLMATLARLSPESVLHNIMPVFTFMGSNVFHRDDTYSFTVVQKTIDNIVPVMVKSLKHSHTSRMELLLGSREFLRVFSDAANHIPRHRRTNFFVHLVNVLGPEDYLMPVCLLLIEKTANRVVRQNAEEAKSTFALPISVLHHYDGALQNSVLSEMILESQRLARRVTDPENLEPTFMDDHLHEEHSTSVTTAFKRRAQAVLSFVGFAVKASSGSSGAGSDSSLVSLLVIMATFKSGQGADARVDDINKVARSSLDRSLRVMSALDYIESTVGMLHSSEQMVQIGALDLLAERLPQVSDHVRQTATNNLVKIIQRIKELLTAHPGSAVAISGFRSLKTIGSGMCAGEESALSDIVPLLLSAIRGRKMALYAVPALSPLASRLGPRLMPFFREIVCQCVALLQEGLEDLSNDTTSVLHGLLTSLSPFWAASEISQVVLLYMNQRKKDDSLAGFVKALTKRAPEKILIPTLPQIWSSLLKSSPSSPQDSYDMFFDIVKRSLRTSNKSVVQENLRSIFNMFLEAFDVVKPQGPLDSKAPIVSAFTELIVNLNEATFRPLFRRLYDWAFVGRSGIERRITFCHVFSALLDYFKALMTPYMSFVLQEFIAYWKSTDEKDWTLWTCILGTVTKSMLHDDGAFWQDDKVKQVYSPLVAQVPVCALEDDESKVLLQDALSALVDNASDDIILKSINLDILMHTRSEEVQTRLFALHCSKAIWHAHGGKLLGFVAETATFIAECSEDENDMARFYCSNQSAFMPRTVTQCTNCGAFTRRSLHHEEEYQSSVLLERLRTSNFPATDEEISHIRHTILPTVSYDIFSIDSKVASLHEVIRSMWEERERLINVHKRYSNLVSLHRALPLEIWSEIFLYTLSSASSYNTLKASGPIWRLSHVCQRWRNIALSLHSSWSTINICFPEAAQHEGDVYRLEAVLQRSRQRLLNISLSDSIQSPGSNPSIQKRILDILLAESYRWQELHLLCPSLETLCLPYEDGGDELAYTPITCSNMRKLDAPSVPVINALTLPRLQEASIRPNPDTPHYDALHSFKQLLIRSNCVSTLTRLSLASVPLAASPDCTLHSILSQTHSLAFLGLEVTVWDHDDETNFGDREQIVTIVKSLEVIPTKTVPFLPLLSSLIIRVGNHHDPSSLYYFGPVGSFASTVKARWKGDDTNGLARLKTCHFSVKARHLMQKSVFREAQSLAVHPIFDEAERLIFNALVDDGMDLVIRVTSNLTKSDTGNRVVFAVSR
ncbi:hypothetical protein BDZ89DRAFT_1137818 [Hymenopellis radicata]|nr:hypothetical protein BDZ89DRAFT_1137818 [Hymenopellis radicata]